MANYSQVVILYWASILQQNLPYPTTRAMTALPSGNGAIKNSNIADYQDSRFDGIYLRTNGLSGANERWYIDCTNAMTGTRFKVYVSFGNMWYVYELQVWSPGIWTINNPSGQPRIPNAVMVGEVIGIFENFPLAEGVPYSPPPTHNPFQPRLVLTGTPDEMGNYIDQVLVMLHNISDLTLLSAYVYENGVLTGIDLTDLLAGHVFDEAGQYQIIINYSYQNNNPENIIISFTIIRIPITVSIILSALKCVVGAKLSDSRFEFGLFDEYGDLLATARNGAANSHNM